MWGLSIMLCQILLFFSWALLDRQMKIIFSFYKMISNIYIFFVCALFSYIIRSRIRTRSRTHKCLPLPVSHYFLYSFASLLLRLLLSSRSSSSSHLQVRPTTRSRLRLMLWPGNRVQVSSGCWVTHVCHTELVPTLDARGDLDATSNNYLRNVSHK